MTDNKTALGFVASKEEVPLALKAQVMIIDEVHAHPLAVSFEALFMMEKCSPKIRIPFQACRSGLIVKMHDYENPSASKWYLDFFRFRQELEVTGVN